MKKDKATTLKAKKEFREEFKRELKKIDELISAALLK